MTDMNRTAELEIVNGGPMPYVDFVREFGGSIDR